IVTERGVAGNAEHRAPSQYRLTYRGADGIMGDGSHEWRKLQTIEDAKATQQAARKAKPEPTWRVKRTPPQTAEYWRPQKTETSRGKPDTSVGENRTENANGPVR